MLTALHIRNYILIDSLDIAFPEGLVIITGQTGAGKSILLGALELVLGGKSDASLPGPSADHCVVEATFDVRDDARVRALLSQADLEETDTLVVRRVVSRSGRSRSFINDEPVTLPVLQGLSGRLVDIHGQHQTLLLSDALFRQDLLDRYAGNEPLLAAVGTAWAALQAQRRALQQVRDTRARLERERDYNQALLARLEAARLQDGEWEALEAEQLQLSHAEELQGHLAAANAVFVSPEGDTLSARLKEAGRQLARAGAYIPSMAALSDRLASVRLDLDDIAAEVAEAGDAVAVSPERLQQVEDRLSLLHELMKRHGVSGVGELIALRDRLSATLLDTDALLEREETLSRACEEAQKAYDAAAARLHAARAQAADPLAAQVQEQLRFLELEGARFSVVLAPGTPGAEGGDTVQFLFSSTGREPVEVSKVASGGELSRIMLCLKAMMARFMAMPTLIFDEIDTGVSGRVADRMGEMIGRMGRDMQVLAITHLPQVAAKGTAHYLVSRQDQVTSIRPLDTEERVQELARMLSGAQVTQAAVDNARALLSAAL